MAQAEHVDPQDSSKRNSPKAAKRPDDANFVEVVACYWNDKKFSAGGTVCDAHRRYECFSGSWIDIGPC